MNIYNQEIKDNLKSLLVNNNFSLSSVISLDNSVIDKVSLANIVDHIEDSNFAEARLSSLFNYNSLLVSTGWNNNDDVFDPQELWKAKDTPIAHRINLEHNDEDIIGTIRACVATDSNHNLIDSPQDSYDLIVASSLYTLWKDPAQQAKMDEIVKEIPSGIWSVSMECAFTNFDYALSKDGKDHIIKRDDQSAFLTKYLRRYGGSGEYQGYKIGRLLRDYVFMGKALTKKPANPKSKILQVFTAKATSEINMEDINEVNKKLDEANKTIASLNLQLKSQEKNEILKEKDLAIASLTEKVSEIETKLASTSTELAGANSKVSELSKDVDLKSAELANLAQAKSELESQLATANENIQKAAKLKKVADRSLLLVNKGVSSDQAESVATSWSEATDEQFEQVLNLVSVSQVKPEENSVVDLAKASVEQNNVVNQNIEGKVEPDCFAKAFDIFSK